MCGGLFLFDLPLSCLLPLFQNESWCTTFVMEISLICMTVNVQELILHQRNSITVLTYRIRVAL